METTDTGPQIAGRKHLETFLGGMETHQQNTAPQATHRLETFLGGMETDTRQLLEVAHSRLETFLGGMETRAKPPTWRAEYPP